MNVGSDYVQNYLELKFEEYYSKVQCPILFLPSEEEWNDEKIRNSIAAFSGLLETYEINHIENSIHAYVWMQLPAVVGRVAKRFIDKHDR